jgi:hypothetical protein
VADGEWDTQRNERGMHRWVYITPGGVQFAGPTWHHTQRSALEAGQDWLAQRSSGTRA